MQKVSKASGFSFDSTNVANEITAVQNVYNEYQTSVEYGFVDPETGIAEMNDKMMAAGLQKIIDEKAAQLAAWRSKQKKFKERSKMLRRPEIRAAQVVRREKSVKTGTTRTGCG